MRSLQLQWLRLLQYHSDMCMCYKSVFQYLQTRVKIKENQQHTFHSYELNILETQICDSTHTIVCATVFIRLETLLNTV